MPRYIVEREFPKGLEIPTTPQGQKTTLGVVENNLTEQVTWVKSFVTDDTLRPSAFTTDPPQRRSAALLV